jgi:hypothetical protein
MNRAIPPERLRGRFGVQTVQSVVGEVFQFIVRLGKS